MYHIIWTNIMIKKTSPRCAGGLLLGKNELIDRLTTEKKEERIFISPLLSSKQLQPASIDVRLGPNFLVLKTGKITHLDPLKSTKFVTKQMQSYIERYKILKKRECFILHPDEFALGCTLEYIRLPVDIAARLEGRSSWGRLGLFIHVTAGFIDPGYRGNITFELKNIGKVPIPLYPGTRLGQLAFFNINNKYEYSGKYQESFGIRSSEYFKDEEFEIIRSPYTCKYYKQKFLEIFESIDNDEGIQLSHFENLPSEIIEAIRDAYSYKRKMDVDIGKIETEIDDMEDEIDVSDE